jgi:S1-C subfamily serine protease
VKRFLPFFLTFLVFVFAPVHATIDDALSFALEAADPYVKQGFTLPVKQAKAIVHQLFKGNEYWFWMGTDTEKATISVHIYDADGALAEDKSFQSNEKKPHKAGAHIIPKKTGTYYLIVEIEKSPAERTYWSLAYGFK